jgi:Tfp pilus assembly protein PilV
VSGNPSVKPLEEDPMSAVAVIVLAIVALLLAAMLVAGLRRSASARTRAAAEEPSTFRSHAEASRHTP